MPNPNSLPNDQELIPETDEEKAATNKRLESSVLRIERLEAEKSGLSEDIKQIYSEAKGSGFEPKILRQIIRLRKMDIQKRREEDMLIDLYKAQLGME